MFVGAAGSPYAAFRRALAARNVALALAEARDLPKLNLADGVELLVLIAEKQPALYECAAVRWACRYLSERTTTLADAQLALAALAAVPGPDGEAASTLLAGLASDRRR
jgi:hypothetical protein